MWTAKQTKMTENRSAAAQMGVVTAGGQRSDVYLGSQRCRLPVMAPGGYRWRPKAGEQVLVLKMGAQGEGDCVLARQEESGAELRPGEVELYAPGCSLKLTQDGQVDVRGSLCVNGTPLDEFVYRAVAAVLTGQEE